MAGKDFGVYRESGGGQTINNWSSGDGGVALDTTVQEDSGFTIDSTTRNFVTQNDDGRVLVMYGGSWSNGGAKVIRMRLMVDTGSGYGEISRAYADYTGVDSFENGGGFGVTLFDGNDGDKYQLRARNEQSSGSVSNDADSTYLQFLQIPAAFDCCILKHSNTHAVTNAFVNQTYNNQVLVDSDTYSIDSTSGRGSRSSRTDGTW